jgi:hypothetical protein
MKKILIRKDMLIEGVGKIYDSLYAMLSLVWVITFFLYFFSREVAFCATIVAKINFFWQLLYEQYEFNGVVLLVLLPFIAPISFSILIGIFSIIRKWIYPANKFTITHNARVIKKYETTTIGGGDSNTETTHYWMTVKNPFKENDILEYALDGWAYHKLKKDDEVLLKTTTNGRWIVWLAAL